MLFTHLGNASSCNCIDALMLSSGIGRPIGQRTADARDGGEFKTPIQEQRGRFRQGLVTRSANGRRRAIRQRIQDSIRKIRAKAYFVYTRIQEQRLTVPETMQFLNIGIRSIPDWSSPLRHVTAAARFVSAGRPVKNHR